jgi:hypothetical protein
MLNCSANLFEITSKLYQMYLHSNMVNTLNIFHMEWNMSGGIVEIVSQYIDIQDGLAYSVATILLLKHRIKLCYSNFGRFHPVENICNIALADLSTIVCCDVQMPLLYFFLSNLDS